jgi:CubicO group peptidase (beta-lactamase class C family)
MSAGIDALLPEIRKQAEDYLSTRDEATLNIGITTRGERRILSLCSPNAQHATAPAPDAIYEIGSISKTFTNTLLAVLEDQGLLSIEDPIGTHLPHLKLRPEVAAITIRDLATHSSGLPGIGQTQQGFILEEIRGSEPPWGTYTHYLRYKKEHLYADLESIELLYPTGQGWLYSIIGMGTLGHILELVTGRSYEDLLREHVCGPLGLSDTGYTMSLEQTGRMTLAYDAEGQPLPNWYHDVLLSQGGLRSTLNDMRSYAEAQLRARLTAESSTLARAMRRTRRPYLVLPKDGHVRREGEEPDGPLSVPWSNQIVHGLAWRGFERGSAWYHPGTTLFYHSGIAVDDEVGVGLVMLSSYRKTLTQMDALNELFMDWFERACLVDR